MIPKYSNIILQKIYYTVLSKKSELMSRKIQLLIQWILTKHLPCVKYHSGLIGIQHWTKGHDSLPLTVYIPVWMYTKTRIFSIHRILLPKNERNNWHVTTHSFNTGKSSILYYNMKGHFIQDPHNWRVNQFVILPFLISHSNK